ncbi:uncharacterized protein N7482_002140 [Penicillium canariense]|uniref:Uncharacterized protein n=1 Tax=Penicillium canariense TaxID=189055 RepID=A0A9W9IGF7_9EURO|nr:uncharacterized protein N7482_002140 [Penicillium canariense]KAJ5176263.1 hypothetical protein N7482_002140 [Penicillium canariense]
MSPVSLYPALDNDTLGENGESGEEVVGGGEGCSPTPTTPCPLRTGKGTWLERNRGKAGQ